MERPASFLFQRLFDRTALNHKQKKVTVQVIPPAFGPLPGVTGVPNFDRTWGQGSPSICHPLLDFEYLPYKLVTFSKTEGSLSLRRDNLRMK